MQPATTHDNKNNRVASRSPTVIIAVLAVTIALVFLVTFLASIPIPGTSQGQVFDAGDIMVFIVALTFGPMIGGVAGGVGSALSDAISPGGGPFAPFTLLIKAGEGLIAGYISQRGFKGRELVAWLSGSLVMVSGYFLAEYYLIGLVFGSSFAPGLTAAIIELPFNVIQVFAGGIVGIPVSRILKRSLPRIVFPGRMIGASLPKT